MSGTTTQNIYQSNIPAFLEPYYKDILENANAAFNPAGYQPYEDANGTPIPRLQDFSQLQQDAFTAAGGLQDNYQGAFDAAGQNISALGGIGSSVANGGVYDPTDYENKGFTQDQYDEWMNPYLSNVLDRAQARATSRFDEQQVGRDQAAARTGSFGGSRSYVTNAMAQRDLNEQLSDLEATQLSQAYTNAQGALTGQRQLGEASKQFDANTKMKGADILGNTANLNLNLGTQQGKADLSSIDAMLKTGGMQQQLGQAELDLDYNDFLNQRDWARNMIGQHANLLRGTPTVQTGSSSTQSSGNATTANQIAGAAVASYPLWRGLFS